MLPVSGRNPLEMDNIKKMVKEMEIDKWNCIYNILNYKYKNSKITEANKKNKYSIVAPFTL